MFHSPAIQAAVPMLVPQQELVRVNGWSQSMQSGAFLPCFPMRTCSYLNALTAMRKVAKVKLRS
ncbi:hypothetical protein [Desulfofarcimen acetoxidans]|uniref:hypothetical protein n=1 Tax=Desulfofarcimen acetoxidans TaxID=58138 RepID=UPI000313C9FE|nr:hypothetical protein [Desulfofarcimen acetoxidans]